MLEPFPNFRQLGDSGKRLYRSPVGTVEFGFSLDGERAHFSADINVTGMILAKLLPQTRLFVQSDFDLQSGERTGRLESFRGANSKESSIAKSVKWPERDAISVVELLWFSELHLQRAAANAVQAFAYFDGVHTRRGELSVDASSPADSFSRAAKLKLEKLNCSLAITRNVITEIVLQAPLIGPVTLELER